MYSRKLFFRYVIPAVLSFALSGVYTIVDGFFVGNSLGDMGLAVINLGYPIAALIQALGTGIGLAGAIRFTIRKAQGKGGEARACFSGTVVLLLITGLAATALFLAAGGPVLRLLGAADGILRLAREYVLVIALGAVLQVTATGLLPFVRNMGGGACAMLAMTAGFLTNILLDSVFVWTYGWGMAGAAWATVIGQGVTMLATVLFLLRKKIGFSPPRAGELPALFGAILKMSFAPFGLTFSPNITLILMNRFLLAYGGGSAVACYACIAYITAVAYLLLQGVGDGSQPLISRFHGERATAELRKTRALAYGAGGVVAAACMVGIFQAREHVGRLFGASAEVNRDVARLLPLFLASLLFLSFVRITTAHFYATEESAISYLLVYAEPVVLLVLLAALPPFTGLTGVWLAVPLAQAATWILSICAKRRADLRPVRG